MALDILEPFPVTSKGNRYVLVLIDYFIKWPEAIPIPDQEALTVLEELIRSWISHYGEPMILYSDESTNFNSALFTVLFKLLGIRLERQHYSPSPMAWSRGLIERLTGANLNHLYLFRIIRLTGIHT
ncbi:hypothetical protein AVEN_234435-1 [Araneus ventricosus]|uniref:Integrase catalytic domain-containing protein n=1 Tax=Araneus ventricosus TaxID=182803 RepID=A0A4Y2A8K8_ARAVE|nr:hypothetical protein AVEN_234435-1 [Araneus ventricosus]